MSTILFQVTSEDIPYLPLLKPIISGRGRVVFNSSKPVSIYEVIMRAKECGATQIATTSDTILQMLIGHKYLQDDGTRSAPAVNDFAGSLIQRHGLEFLILNPVEHLVTTSTGAFLYKRYLSKFWDPENWMKLPAFKWELFDPSKLESIIETAANANFAALDIETNPDEERTISCISFSFVRFTSSTCYSIRTVCIPIDSHYNLLVVKTLCEMQGLDKVFQNGKYDNAYLLRYGICCADWSGDTQHLFHAWYSELPKRLDFLASFSLRVWEYWKDEAKTSDKISYYGYNAKDSFATALIWIALLQEIPPWAMTNYVAEFRLVFPCLLVELQGMALDMKVMEDECRSLEYSLDLQLNSIRTMVANVHYNPSSPKQTLQLFATLGSEDIKDTKPPAVDRVRNRHPLNDRIVGEIVAYRKTRKLVTSYFRDKYYDAKRKLSRTKSWNGRAFFALNPHGTDTGRLASRESAFWCGFNIQNIPSQAKAFLVSDPGFYLGECDRSQAEARDVAYLSGDASLIAAVDDSTKDFHGRNAAAFFGLHYERIVNTSPVRDGETGEIVEYIHKVVDKIIRDTSKRTNHGANYNMSAGVLLDTMGIQAVLTAQRLLHLPISWPMKKVCQYLLDKYDATYPVVRGAYYDDIISRVNGSHLLVGPTGWTRYCFGKPDRKKNKRDLNRYAAHPSQSLNAMELNEAYTRVFYNIALKEPEDFRLGPQIHDSIVFQYRIGRIDLAKRVAVEMHIPLPVTDIFGITRTLIIPTDLKGESNRWSDLLPIR